MSRESIAWSLATLFLVSVVLILMYLDHKCGKQCGKEFNSYRVAFSCHCFDKTIGFGFEKEINQ